MEHQADGDFGYAWLKTNGAGSGAYTLRTWKPSETIMLESNPNYRGGEAKLKRVVVRHVPEPAAQRLLLEKGDADIVRDLTPDQVAGLEGNKDVVVTPKPQALLYYAGMNLKKKELSDVRVRQAIRYSVDYDGMVNSFLKGTMQVHQTFWPSGFWAALDDNLYNYDPAKAKALLAEAGFPNGIELNMEAPNTAPFVNIAQSMQASMAASGVKLNINSAETKTVITKYRAREHDIALIYWGPDYMDPHTNADGFAMNPDNSDNAKGKPLAWRNSWYDEAVNGMTMAAVRERDSAKREQMYKDLQKKVLVEGPYIIMFQNTIQLAQRANVKDFVMGPSTDVVYYNLTTK
jgi:peptide/nickel transport system substrate-binding protein